MLCLISSHALSSQNLQSKADTIISNVLQNSEYHGNYIEEYEASVYLKGDNNIRKRNFLYRYAPDFLYLDTKGRNNFVESIIDIHYKSPNQFSQKIVALNGQNIHYSDIEERVMPFLNVNIYNPSVFNDFLLFPESKDVVKYYQFEYVSSKDTLNHLIHKIRIVPKIKTQKLISGYVYIVDRHWTIYKFEIEGKWEFSDYQVETEFALPEEEMFLLPLQTSIRFQLKLLGNDVVNHYFSSYNYRLVRKKEKSSKPLKVNYELTDFYNVTIDSTILTQDEAFWEKNRTFPLNPYEKSLISNNTKDSVKVESTPIDIFQQTIGPRRFYFNNSQFRYSGLINPFRLAYSKSDGFIYWQKLRFRFFFQEGKELSFNPAAGYLFKSKEIYFNLPVNWVIQPKCLAELNFDFGNKNKTYNFNTRTLISEGVSDTIQFEDLNLDYYRHYYMRLSGQYEVTNGLVLSAGLNYSWYTPVKSGKKENEADNSTIGGDIENVVKDRYYSFAPVATLTWTPQQYYRYNIYRKEYVRSKYPTFSLQYTRGIKGILSSDSYYELIELDVQQKIPLGLMRSVQYYAACGKFTNKKSVFFADFNYFQKRNIPQSWDDPIGGIFHLLDGKWYNASDTYIQGHFMYEAPFIILHFFPDVAKDILHERFYFSQLYTPMLTSYSEIGYGVGNYLGNIGLFFSFKKEKFDSLGLKFAFEFDR